MKQIFFYFLVLMLFIGDIALAQANQSLLALVQLPNSPTRADALVRLDSSTGNITHVINQLPADLMAGIGSANLQAGTILSMGYQRNSTGTWEPVLFSMDASSGAINWVRNLTGDERFVRFIDYDPDMNFHIMFGERSATSSRTGKLIAYLFHEPSGRFIALPSTTIPRGALDINDQSFAYDSVHDRIFFEWQPQYGTKYLQARSLFDHTLGRRILSYSTEQVLNPVIDRRTGAFFASAIDNYNSDPVSFGLFFDAYGSPVGGDVFGVTSGNYPFYWGEARALSSDYLYYSTSTETSNSKEVITITDLTTDTVQEIPTNIASRGIKALFMMN